MIYPIKADLIPLLENLVTALQPFAKANFVRLFFNSDLKKLEITYHPENILPDLTQILCRLITLTPQDYAVSLNVFEVDDFIKIEVVNTGSHLDHIGEIINGVRQQVSVRKQKNGGTIFELRLPAEKTQSGEQTIRVASPQTIREYVIPPFFKKLKDSLRFHFTNLENLEIAASARSEREGVFLKKVNAVIIAHLGDEFFDMEALCKATALSRSQLYRRLKPLIRQAPAHYIKYVRLQKAKEMMDNPEFSIGEIAFRAGFMNQSHFTRAFREQFGFNPSEVKRNKTKEENESKYQAAHNALAAVET